MRKACLPDFLQIGTYAVHQIMSTAPFDACTGCPDITFLQVAVHHIHDGKHSDAVFHGQDLQNTFFTVFFNFPLMVAAQPE